MFFGLEGLFVSTLLGYLFQSHDVALCIEHANVQFIYIDEILNQATVNSN